MRKDVGKAYRKIEEEKVIKGKCGEGWFYWMVYIIYFRI